MESIVVSTLDGLFDEEAEAAIYEINDRRFCLQHSWVNASLQWWKEVPGENRIWAVSFRGKGWCGAPDWGLGYGGIRFCKRCKRIDCIHLFEELTYKILVDNHAWSEHVIGTCKRCHRRILLTGWKVLSASQEAKDLIQAVADEQGISWTGNPSSPSSYGSYYFTDFPVAVARMIDAGAEEKAREFVRTTFMLGAEPGLSVLAV